MSAGGLQKKGGGSLFWIALPLCTVVALLGVLWPEGLAAGATAFTRTAFRALDWFFMASVSGFVVLMLWLALGPYGRVRLGKPEDRPEFSTSSWLAMLFAAGMGTGLLFWGVAEPVTHFTSPPVGDGGTAQAARQAMVITNFHWGLHAWGVYGVGALILAYFGFRHGMPYLAGSPIRRAFRGRWVGPVASLSDVVAVLAVAFGVAGSLGMGTLQIHSGLSVLFGAPAHSPWSSMGILVALVVSYVISASTGLNRGIKWLSNINMVLAVALLGFVLVTGPTGFLLAAFVTSLSDYLSNIVGMSLRLYPFADVDQWVGSWTLTYFIWWIAWAPFVGIFIARISRGRTIREFVLGVLLAPTMLSMLWFAVFGGTALHRELHGEGGIAEAVSDDVTMALFAFFDTLPLSPVLGGLALGLIFVFVVTSVDSATYVLGMLTSGGALVPPTGRKLAWGIGLGVLSAGLVVTDNIEAIKAIAVTGAVPFTFILLLQVAALLRTLPEERGRPAEESPSHDPAEGRQEDDR